MRLFISTICLLVITAATLAKTSEVEYYAILMEGSKIGHLQRIREVEGDTVTTKEDMTMSSPWYLHLMPIDCHLTPSFQTPGGLL